jgi:hypothetical protein
MKIFHYYNLSAIFKNIFLFIKTKGLVLIDLSGILNCVTFSEAPTTINEKVKKCAVPLKNGI